MENDMSWGERLIHGVMKFGLGSICVVIVATLITAGLSWQADSPILDNILKVLGIAILFLVVIGIIAFVEFLQRPGKEGDS